MVEDNVEFDRQNWCGINGPLWEETAQAVQDCLASLVSQVCRIVPGTRTVTKTTHTDDYILLCTRTLSHPAMTEIDPVVVSVTFQPEPLGVEIEVRVYGENTGDPVVPSQTRQVHRVKDLMYAAKEMAGELLLKHVGKISLAVTDKNRKRPLDKHDLGPLPTDASRLHERLLKPICADEDEQFAAIRRQRLYNPNTGKCDYYPRFDFCYRPVEEHLTDKEKQDLTNMAYSLYLTVCQATKLQATHDDAPCAATLKELRNLPSRVEFMVRMKLPSSAAFHGGPSGDTDYERAYKQALSEQMPPYFEAVPERTGDAWPTSRDGTTYVRVRPSVPSLLGRYYQAWSMRCRQVQEKLAKALEVLQG